MRSIWLIYLASDVVAVVLAYAVTLYVRFYSGTGEEFFGALMRLAGVQEAVQLGPEMPLFYLESAFRIIFILSITICFLYGFLDLYAGRRFLLRRSVAFRVMMANAVALGLFYCYFYARMNVFHPRTIFATVAFLNTVFCVLLRGGLDRFLQFARARFRFDECRAVLVGSDEMARLLDKFIAAAAPQGVCVVDRVEFEAGLDSEALAAKVRESVLQHGAHMVICADGKFTAPGIMRIIQLSEELNVDVKVHSKEMNVLLTSAKLAADVIRDAPLVHFALPSGSMAGRWMRSAVARVLALALFVLFLPLLLLVALLVKVTSSGPVLFIQERIGVNRLPFRMYKFRTMHRLADETQAEVEELNESGVGLFKIRKDPRITFVGGFLRRFSLDELPQLANVIRGEMALVGPRPLPRRDFEHYYEDWHYIRHGGLPGLTCLWQVSGRSDLDFHNMCILDVYYLRNRSFMLDLKILLKTLIVVVFAKGAY
jgi:exopolysaccharide biosynthesis polyprenyl glycosylphosphotransferase